MLTREGIVDPSPEGVEVDMVGVDEKGGIIVTSESNMVRLRLSDVEVRH